jgi:hypothetical protein
MSCHQTAGWNHNIKASNKSLKNMTKFKYFGMNITNQNYIHEEIKSRLISGNACCHADWNLLSSHLLSKNIKAKIYKTMILPVILIGYETRGRTQVGMFEKGC